MFDIKIQNKNLDKVIPILEECLKKCENVLPVKENYKIIVAYGNNPYMRDCDGSTGYTEDKNTVHVEVDTEIEGWEKSVQGTGSHEHNHVVRFQELDTKKEQTSILDSIALEGLAQCFEVDITGVVPVYSSAISNDQAISLWKKIKPYLSRNSRDVIYGKFFFGDYIEFPRFGGYAMSYLIAKKRKQEFGLSWPELSKLDSKTIVGNGLD